MTVDGTVLRKLDAGLPAAVIDSAVVSSVRRDPFRGRSKCRSEARSSPTKSPRQFVAFRPTEKIFAIWISWVQLQCFQGLCACA